MIESTKQSLFFAGDEDPKVLLARDKPIYAFSNYDFALSWMKAHNKKAVYQIVADEYVLDKKRYVRRSGDGFHLSDNEYIVKKISDSKKIID